MDEGRALSAIFELLVKDGAARQVHCKRCGKVAGFNGSTSKPYGLAMLNIELHGKAISIFDELYCLQWIARPRLDR